jgi:2-methylisocitrate lyase-like PEP mutase family enzyme
MSSRQTESIRTLRELHSGPGSFVIANAFDPGSARILEGLGFKALATSSGAAAGVLGRLDGSLTREESLSHAEAIAAAVDVPDPRIWSGASVMRRTPWRRPSATPSRGAWPAPP